MASVHILYYSYTKNSDGTSPIVIQVYTDKRIKRTLANVRPDQWDPKQKRVKPKSHPNYAVINIKISNEYNRVEALILNNKFDLKRDFIDYFDNLKAGIDPKTVPVEKPKSFKEIVPLYIASLKSGHSMVGYQARLNYFIRESGIGDIRSSQITKEHIDRFIKFMADKGNKRSTMRTQLKIIRYASTFAEKNGYDSKSAAVHNYPLPIAERSLKLKLNKEELSRFKAVDLSDDPRLQQIQDMFLLAVYLRGMRAGDVIQLRQDYFKNGRIVYESGKTKKMFNIKLIPEATEIVNKYLDGRTYLFTFFKWKENKGFDDETNKKARAKHVSSIETVLNAGLKIIAKEKAGLTKNVSFHIARHIFAKMAIDKVKDFNLSMDLVGHSNIEEHERYIRELSQDEELDNAADDIFS